VSGEDARVGVEIDVHEIVGSKSLRPVDEIDGETEVA
jgi:hypothetical protein